MFKNCIILIVLSCTLYAQDQTDSNRRVASVQGRDIFMADVVDEEIMKLRRALFEKLERAIAEKAAAVLENHPHDGDPEHLIEHFRASVSKGEVALYIDVPPKPQVEVQVSEAYIRKYKEAPLMIMAFIDAQCPFCTDVHPTLERLSRKYRGDLAIAWRHYPLERHEGADLAAMALECAREQNKFEPYHNALMANPKKQARAQLIRYANQIRIADEATFVECLDEKRYKHRLEEDQRLAQSLGINSTPSFVIGNYVAESGMLKGEVVEGALDFLEFVKIIEKYKAAEPE